MSSCRHVRSIVSLALDALATPDSRHAKANLYNQRLVRAMRLRYGLDDNRPRTLKEVSPSPSEPNLSPPNASGPGVFLPVPLMPYNDLSASLQPPTKGVPLSHPCSWCVSLCHNSSGGSALQVSQEMQNSVESVRMLVEEGKEQLAEILAQMGLMKDIQMSA